MKVEPKGEILKRKEPGGRQKKQVQGSHREPRYFFCGTLDMRDDETQPGFKQFALASLVISSTGSLTMCLPPVHDLHASENHHQQGQDDSC